MSDTPTQEQLEARTRYVDAVEALDAYLPADPLPGHSIEGGAPADVKAYAAAIVEFNTAKADYEQLWFPGWKS